MKNFVGTLALVLVIVLSAAFGAASTALGQADTHVWNGVSLSFRSGGVSRRSTIRFVIRWSCSAAGTAPSTSTTSGPWILPCRSPGIGWP